MERSVFASFPMMRRQTVVTSDDLRQALRQVLDFGLGLSKGLGVSQPQTVPAPDQVQTPAEARIAGVQAAVQALLTALGPLIGPRYMPTLTEGRKALEHLRQRRAVQSAYQDGFEKALAAFCEQLEDLLLSAHEGQP